MKMSEIMVSGALAAWSLVAIAGAGGYYFLKVAPVPVHAAADSNSGGWWKAGRSRDRHFCSSPAETRSFSSAAPFLKIALSLNATQYGALRALTLAADSDGKAAVIDLCGLHKADGTAPERLKRLASALGRAAETLDRLQPQLDTFYATLDEDQQKRFDTYLSHAARHHEQAP